MKRLWSLSLPLLLAALLLAACGQGPAETAPSEEAPPAVDAVPETEGAGATAELPEGAVRLTAEETRRVNEAFTPVFTDKEENMSWANPLDSFFTCYYRTPEEIDLSAFLEYSSLSRENDDSDGTVSREEYAALVELEDWSFERDRPQEDMPVPIHRFPRDRVDDFLSEHAGVKTENLTAPWTTGLYCLEDFDAYYNTTSDFGPGVFQCEGGWYTDTEARLTGGHSVLTLENREGRWLIRSFLPEGAVPLTAEEIAQVNEAFRPTLEREGGLYVNPRTCWVSSYYRWPEELDLSAFLRHFSSGAELSGEAEFEALKAAEGWPFGDISRDRMPVPIGKILRSDVDASLKEHMGITTEYLYSVPYSGPGAREYSRSSPFLYLPEYEAYYNFVSDVDPGYFQCVSGWYSEAVACLTGDNSVLTLRNRDGSWYFQSFLPLRTK